MALDSSGVRTSVLLDLSQFDAQTALLKQKVAEVGDIVQRIPDAKPKIDTQPLTDDAARAKKLADEVADAIGHLTGGRVELDIGQLERAGADAQKILGTLTEGFASSAAAAAVFTAAVVAAGVEIEHVLVEMGEHWEAAFRQMAATTGVTGEALERFETSAVNVGKNSAASTESVVAAMQQLSNRLNLTGSDLETVTGQTLKFAKVWSQDAGDAAKSLSQIMTLFHEPSTNAAKDLDTLTAVAQKTQIPMAQLEDELKGRLGPVLVSLGFSLAEAGLLLGNMARQGEAGRAAMLAFNKVLTESAAAGKDPQIVFAQLVEQLKAAGDVGTTSADVLVAQFGRAFPLLSAMAKNGSLDVKEMAQDIETSGGQVNDAFEVMRSGADKIGAQLTILRNQFAPVGIEIAKVVNQLETDLAGAIGQATQAVAAFLDMAAKVNAALPPQVTAAAAAAPALALGPAGIPIVASAIAGAGAASPEEAGGHGAEAPGGTGAGAGAAAIGGAADLAAPKVDALTKQIAALHKEIDAAGQDTALITTLLTTIQTLEDVQKAVKALPPALGAEAEAAVHAVEAEQKANEERVKAADDLAKAMASQAGVARDTAAADAGNIETTKEGARAALEERDAIRALLTGRTENVGLVIAEKNARDALDQVETAYATAEKSRAAAVAAGTSAEEAATAAAQAHAAAMPSLTDALAKYIDAAALFSVQQERANTILSQAKPYLDAHQEASIKVAVAQGDLAKALTIAGQAMGLTDTQIQALIGSLGGSQTAFDLEVNSVKALKIPHDELEKTLGSLASAAYPRLGQAQADSLRQTIASGDAQKEAAAVAATYGVSVDDLNAHIAQGTEKLQEWEKQQLAANRALADFVKDEDKSRISSGLLGLAKDLDSVTAAQVKQAEESGNTAKALDLLAGGLGLQSGVLHQWEADLKAGGAAAVAAREQIAELTTQVRNASGQIDIKVNVDIQKVQEQIGQLQQNFQEANTARAQAATDLAHTEQLATRDFQRQIDSIAETHNKALDDINAARDASASQLGSDLAHVAQVENKALADVGVTERAAQTTFHDAMTAAQAQHDLAFANATKTYTDGLKAVQDQTASAIEQVAKAQAAGLTQLSAAMTTFNQQQVQNAFNQSVALQTAQNAANRFTDTQSVASAVRSAQIQAEGAAGLAQQNQATALAQSQNSIAQQQVDAQKALTQATIDAAKQMQKLSDDLKNAKIAADVQLGNAGVGAQRTLDISRYGADFYNATRTQNQTVALINGQPYIVDSTTINRPPVPGLLPEDYLDLLAQRGIKIAGTAGTRLDTESAAQQQVDAAQARFDARTAQLNKAEAAAQKRDEDQTKAAREAREEQVRHFLEQERAQREAQRKADEQYQRELHKLRVQEETLQSIKDLPAEIAKKLHLGPEQLNFQNNQFLETGVDYVGSLVTNFSTHITGGGGG